MRKARDEAEAAAAAAKAETDRVARELEEAKAERAKDAEAHETALAEARSDAETATSHEAARVKELESEAAQLKSALEQVRRSGCGGGEPGRRELGRVSAGLPWPHPWPPFFPGPHDAPPLTTHAH